MRTAVVRAFAVLVAFVGALAAQERLRVQGPTPATLTLGASARVNFVIEGRSGQSQPPALPKVPDLDVQVFGPSRQVYTNILGGRVEEQVTSTWQVQLTPRREGTFTIPAFRMNTGTREQEVPAMQITVVKELRGAEFGYLDVRVDPVRVYVHEPIRVRVEFGVDKGLRPVQDVAQDRTRYLDFEVQAPWLTEMDGAESLEVPKPSGDTVPVVLNRRLQQSEFDSGHVRAGKTYNSFVFHKSFLPTRPGKLVLDAPMLRYNVQLTEGRVGLFGERVGAQMQNYYVYGKPLELEVLPIPEAGRPQPYYGAVGRFELNASLDKDTVKVGNSVKLTFEITGSGNFEFLRLPDLSDFEQKGLHVLGQTEQRSAEKVSVVYDLTPLSAEVKQVPPIRWNWFDTRPGQEKFVVAESPTLPLHVVPLAAGETLAPLPDAAKATVTPGVDDVFDLPSFQGPPATTPRANGVLAAAAAFGPWLVLLLGAAFTAAKRRRERDPLRQRAVRALRTLRAALQDGGAPGPAFEAFLADKLGCEAAAVVGPDLEARLAAAGLDAALARRCTEVVERGVAARYGGVATLDADAVRSLAEEVDRARVGSAPRAVLVLLAAGLLGAGAPAQQDDGYAAYRRGDYAAAKDAFLRAADQQDDRRLWFALGNCYWRLSDLPRARWAYERARIGMPRDAELLANLALVEKRLAVDDTSEPFAAAVAALRDRFTPGERTLAMFAFMALAALLLGAFPRRPGARWCAAVLAAHGALLAIDLLWLAPSRPVRAVAVQELQLVSEPRDGLPAVATVAPGALVDLRSSAVGEWVRVDAGSRSGYVRTAAVARID